jgi:DNA-binding CsgD family transcriptional regulator
LTLLQKNQCPSSYQNDLAKAVNRVDFFRIFHAMALRTGFDHFCLMRLFSDVPSPTFSSQLELHDLPAGLAEAYDERFAFAQSGMFKMLHETTIPTVWLDAGGSQDELMRQLGFELALRLPTHGVNGSRHAVIFIGDRDMPDAQQLQAIYYDACYAFDHYFREILANKKGMGLTPRELEILRWISHGKTASEIALIVSVSEHTVNSHTATILKKLDVVNRTQMVAKALREQIIP